MLVIEGADLVGKTTFAKACVAELNRRGLPHMYMHLSRPPKRFDHYRGYLDKISRDTVWDRFHLGEIAYRAHDDYPTEMTPMKYSLVDAAIHRLGGYVVVLHAPPRVIEKRHAERGDGMYDLESILRVNATFMTMSNEYRAVVDMRGQQFRTNVDAAFSIADVDEVMHWTDVVLGHYIGRLHEVRELDR